MTSPARISRKEVLRVAALAHLELTPAEIRLYTQQFNALLERLEDLQSEDTAGVEPLVSLYGDRDGTREDTPRPSLERELVLSNAPQVSEHHIVVPLTIRKRRR